jgi:acid stress chaperone HdeB
MFLALRCWWCSFIHRAAKLPSHSRGLQLWLFRSVENGALFWSIGRAALIPPSSWSDLMKLWTAVCVAATIFAGQTAKAEVLDLSTITCKQFFETLKQDEASIILSWLHGYYRDEKDPPVIDTDDFKKDMAKLGAFCGANPSLGLITAADKTLGK